MKKDIMLGRLEEKLKLLSPDALGAILDLTEKLSGATGKSWLKIFKRFLRKEGPIWLIVDCDTIPFVPENWVIMEHRKNGQFVWDPSKISLYLSLEQQNGKYIEGHRLRRELKHKLVLNANVLGFLLDHKELIPEEWKDKTVFFWGTIYRGPGNCLYVRGLNCDNEEIGWIGFLLGDELSSSDYAALHAS